MKERPRTPVYNLTYTSEKLSEENTDKSTQPVTMGSSDNKRIREFEPTAEKIIDEAIELSNRSAEKYPGQIVNPEILHNIVERDGKIKRTIYDGIKYWKTRLTADFDKKKTNTTNKEDLRQLNSNPYIWLLYKTRKSNDILREKLKKPNLTEDEKRDTNKYILANTEILDSLTEAYERKVPLKLEREIESNTIRLDRGTEFNATKNVDLINELLNKKEPSYTIEGMIQRGNQRFIQLRIPDGRIVKLGTAKLDNIFKKAEDFLRQAKQNDTIEVLQNGARGIYRVINKDSVEQRVNDVTVSIPIEILKEILSKPDVVFNNLTIQKDKAPEKKQEVKKGIDKPKPSREEEIIENLKENDIIRIRFPNSKNKNETTLTVTKKVGDIITVGNTETKEKSMTMNSGVLKKYIFENPDVEFMRVKKGGSESKPDIIEGVDFKNTA